MANRQLRRQQSQRGGRQRGGSLRGAGGPRRPAPGGGGPADFLSWPYIIGVTVLVVVLAGIVVFLALRDDGTGSSTAQALRDAHEAFPADLADGAAVGSPDAPVVVREWGDYNCHFCLGFAADQEPGIVEEYVKTGKVRLEFNHMPILGARSLNAALAATCATEQDRFWDYSNRLFIGQAEGDQFTDEKLRDYARELGLDLPAFEACYADPNTLEAVDSQHAEGTAFGIQGTPGFVINGQPLVGGAPASIEGWRQLLDEFYQQATAGDATDDGADATSTTTPASGG
ncbi:MAG: hypothetical protein Kow0010_25500 [Dehalococcoidia bacterium]